MIISIVYKGIDLDCKVKVTTTYDPLCTGDSSSEIDVEYDWIALQNNSTEDLMPLLENDMDKITDLVIAAYRGK
jgi:hypothetical protein